jgi:hypothetical protein
MLYSTKNLVFIIFVLVVLFTGCEKKEAPAVDYKSEANALCEAFNPDYWKDIPADTPPAELQDMLAKKIEAAVNSEKMKEVVATIPKMPAKLRYKYVVESITDLTGEPFSCPGMEDYFNPL